MTDFVAAIRQAASSIEGVDGQSVDICPVILESGAIGQVGPFLQNRGFNRIVIAADTNTHAVGGQALLQSVTGAGVSAQVVIITPDHQGDVIADEKSIVQLILELKSYAADAVVALGSGTLHDLARFSAYSVGIPFVSVPTAPSVDGFNSKGAPLIIRGDKKTIQSIGPAAIFADLDLLTQAPTAMIAAGFGDMLGKYTSLFDWKFGHLAGNEPYSDIVADITRNALEQCVQHIDEIAKRSPEGIRILTQGLIESGFAMLLFGQSHSASGAEHHLSHYWEMEFLRQGRRAVLHGAKVGVACAEISRLYHLLADTDSLPVESTHKKAILEEIAQIPEPDTIRIYLRQVGGPAVVEELGVNQDLLVQSLREADHIRSNRYTLLRAYNELRRK